MAWLVVDSGSWSVCVTDDPDNEMAVALAIPSAWRWHPGHDTVLVPSDQVGQLVGR